MEIYNVHERELESDPKEIGALIDSLASREDRLWPGMAWPRMEFDGPLGVGAKGGHGPIRYYVEEYDPGKSVKFRFTGPEGFDGFHGFEIVKTPGYRSVLRHTLKMNIYGPAILSWPLVYRPMHDALIEDSLTNAQQSLGESAQIQAWSLWVKTLRWMISGRRARSRVRNSPLRRASRRPRRRV
jgi:hypothetical protein